MKYLLGTSAYSNTDLLEKCINSWSLISKNLDITKGIFFDGKNWRQIFKDSLQKVGNNVDFILTLDDHVGVSGAWNEILKYGFIENNFDVIIICGSDIEFKQNYIENYIEKFEEQGCEFSTAKGFGFNCFAMTKRCYETVGEFDLNFFPSYMEDNDYATRIRISKLNWKDIGNPDLFFHEGSATIRKNKAFENANGITFPIIQKYLIKKWGIKDITKIDEYSYQTPFNDPNLTIKDWTLDLEKYNYKKQVWNA